MISVNFQGKPFDITVIQVCAPASNAEAEVEWFYEDLQELLELTQKRKKKQDRELTVAHIMKLTSSLTSYFCIPVPRDEKDIFFGFYF